MSDIKSQTVEINKSEEEIFNFISDFTNFSTLFPPQVKDLKITNNIIYADSGVMLGKLVKESMKHKLTGLESLAGVPGTLGGALKMNAGAWGSEISNYLTSVEIVDINGDVKTLRPIDLNFGYRNSSFSSKDFILSAQFKLESSSKEDIKIKKQINNAKLHYKKQIIVIVVHKFKG